MGLQSAMQTGLTGMQAAETTIDVVGNNVANSNTVGFKQSEVNFATQFLQTQSIGGAPTNSTGGTNPRQIGLGVKVAEIQPDFTQGTIEISSNPLDIAIEGDGFLIVQAGTGGEQLYTRNGQLKTNADNEIVTTTGHRVLGYGVNDQFEIEAGILTPLTIPFGASAIAQQTSNAFLTGNLLPQGEIGDTPGVIDSVILSNNSIEVPTDLGTNDIGQLEPPAVDTAASAANASGSGVIDLGTYDYKIVFVDPTAATGFDEAAPSLAFGTVAVDGTQSVDLSSLPTSSDPGLTAKRIYRTDSSGDYRLVAEIPNAQTTYTDNTTNAALGAVLDEDALDLANLNYFITFYNSSSGFESRPTSQTISVNISDPNRRIRLENLPSTSSGDFDSIRIYRNTDQSPNTWYEVDTLPMGTTSYIDRTPDSVVVGNAELDRNGPSISSGLPLVNVSTFDGSKYVDLFEEGTLSFAGKKGVNPLEAKEMEITPTTTVQDLIDFMEEAMGVQTFSPDPDNLLPGSPGGLITGDSRLEFVSNMGTQNELDIGLTAFKLTPSGSSTAESIPLAFTQTQEANGDGASAEFVAYDSLGIPMSVRLTTVRESAEDNGTVTRYRWFATSPDNQPADGVDTTIGTGIITFDQRGQFLSASSSSVSVERRDVASASPVEFELDFTSMTAVEDAAGDSTMKVTRQDGFPAGTLTSFQITESGRINGIYSNGITRDIGQMRMARFTNSNGLVQRGDNLWAEGVNSGRPLEDDPGRAGLGTLSAGAVELSNTDIGENLIELILASTQYRGNARVITAAQELLDELMALRR